MLLLSPDGTRNDTVRCKRDTGIFIKLTETHDIHTLGHVVRPWVLTLRPQPSGCYPWIQGHVVPQESLGGGPELILHPLGPLGPPRLAKGKKPLPRRVRVES